MFRTFLKRQSVDVPGPSSFRATLVSLSFLVLSVAVRANPGPSPASPAGAPATSASAPGLSTATTPTPVTLRIRTIDKTGKEQIQTIEIQGPVTGDLEGFRRDFEVPDPTPNPTKVPPLSPPGRILFNPAPTSPSLNLSSARAAERLFRQAQGYFRQGRIPEGRKFLQEIFRHYPQTRWAGEGHVAWGRQAESAGQWEEALRHFDDPSVALVAPARRAQAGLAAAEALAMLDRFDESRHRASKALQSAPGSRLEGQARALLARLQPLGGPPPPIRLETVLDPSEAVSEANPDAPSKGSQPVQNTTNTAPTDSPTTLPLAPGRVTWINFFQTDCSHCEDAYPRQLAQAETALADGADVLWIGFDDSAPPEVPIPLAPYHTYLETHSLPGLVGLDLDHCATFRAFGGQGSPWSVLVDKEGLIRFNDVYNAIKVRDKLTQLLREAPPHTRQDQSTPSVATPRS